MVFILRSLRRAGTRRFALSDSARDGKMIFPIYRLHGTLETVEESFGADESGVEVNLIA